MRIDAPDDLRLRANGDIAADLEVALELPVHAHAALRLEIPLENGVGPDQRVEVSGLVPFRHLKTSYFFLALVRYASGFTGVPSTRISKWR